MNKCCAPKNWDSWKRAHLPCGNKGKVERDGKWYCDIHDPEKVKARDAARNAKCKRRSELAFARGEVSQIEKGIVKSVLETYEPLPTSLVVARGQLRDAKAKVAELEALK